MKTNSWTTATKPKTYGQALTHWLKFCIESEARTTIVQLKSEA